MLAVASKEAVNANVPVRSVILCVPVAAVMTNGQLHFSFAKVWHCCIKKYQLHTNFLTRLLSRRLSNTLQARSNINRCLVSVLSGAYMAFNLVEWSRFVLQMCVYATFGPPQL